LVREKEQGNPIPKYPANELLDKKSKEGLECRNCRSCGTPVASRIQADSSAVERGWSKKRMINTKIWPED
ncbi:MAG: hypothetical protein KDD53_12145, partial [Bdellovibrionales bacterium]|nr:hypothetical protein [Bdellovibrionales bacterium]